MSTELRTRHVVDASNRRISSWMRIALVALAAAALGLAAGYLLFDSDPADEVAPEVETLLADYWTAAAAGDADAVVELLTEDAAFFRWDLPAQEAHLREAIAGWSNLTIERVGEPVVVDKPGSYIIAQRGSLAADEILYLITTTEEDGQLKIASMTPYYDVE